MTDPATVHHWAHPPTHDCRACGQPWPCPEAQCNLFAEFYGDPVGLALYLARMLEVAIADRETHDLPVDLPTVHARYLGWISMARRGRLPS